MNLAMLRVSLIQHEGQRAKPYRDSVGKLTIGVGRNLDDRGLSADEIDLLLDNDLRLVAHQLGVQVPWWSALDDARQNVLAEMGFNLGLPRLLGFRRMLAALQQGDFVTAADEMLDSKWANEVGQRAFTLARRMRNGELA